VAAVEPFAATRKSWMRLNPVHHRLNISIPRGARSAFDVVCQLQQAGTDSQMLVVRGALILAFSTVPARQGVGANGTCLQADSTQSTGINGAAL
jgi:hypothetical protein